MGAVEEAAAAEAHKKGLTGARAKAYVGGAFHRAAAWHQAHITPKTGKGAAHLSRRAKRMALADERQGEENRARIREMQTNAGKFRLKALRQRELPGNSGTAQTEQKAPKPASAPAPQAAAAAPSRDDAINPYRRIDVADLERLYGRDKLGERLGEFSASTIRQAAKDYGVEPGRTKEKTIRRILANMDGQPASAPAPQAAAAAEHLSPATAAAAARAHNRPGLAYAWEQQQRVDKLREERERRELEEHLAKRKRVHRG